MQFIVSGERIATENFSIGKVYTVTFTNGNYFVNSCVGIGPDFVMFQQESPKMLFCLDMESAETVSSIDESGGGAGTMNYNELDNKPSINGVPLIGNKTAADLSILPVPIVGENDNNKILTASYSGGVGSYSWQPAPSSGTTDYTQLSNKPQINSVELDGNKSLEDLGIASAEALAGKQDVISDLSTIRSGAAAGATAVQPATLASYQPLIDSSHKLDPALVATDTNNRFATDTQLNQIETNKTNILTVANTDHKNVLQFTQVAAGQLAGATWTVNSDNSVTVNTNGTLVADSYVILYIDLNNKVYIDKYCNGQYKLTGCPAGGANDKYILYAASGTYTKIDTGSGIVLDSTSNTNIQVVLSVAAGRSYTNLTFKPMISLIGSDSTYEPYAPTNAELYAMIQTLQ